MKAIIYGTGKLGQEVLKRYKHKETYDVIYFGDSDKSKWGNKFEGIEIKSPEFIVEYERNNECIIIIASMYIAEIMEVLKGVGLDPERANIVYTSIINDFLTGFRKIKEMREGSSEPSFKMRTGGKSLKKMLFVQSKECTRTLKIATCVKSRGIEIDHAYTNSYDPEGYGGTPKNTYGKTIRITDFKTFMDFVNASDYDIIHCSNETDFLAALLVHSNKKIVHDCHDMMTLRDGYNLTSDMIVNEYTASVYSDGNLYVTDTAKDYAVNKYSLKNKPLFSINNYALSSQKPARNKEKLSEKDGGLHCVYEGGIVDASRPSHHRYIEPLLISIANAGIHVHFYGALDKYREYYKVLEEKSPFIHNEGYVCYDGLVEELTQYDIGLAMLNVNEKNRDFLSSTFPNKFFDYLMAELPVAAVDIPPYRAFVEKYKCGIVMDFSANIKEQLIRADSIEIPRTFSEDNGMLMEQHIDELMAFYESVMAGD